VEALEAAQRRRRMGCGRPRRLRKADAEGPESVSLPLDALAKSDRTRSVAGRGAHDPPEANASVSVQSDALMMLPSPASIRRYALFSLLPPRAGQMAEPGKAEEKGVGETLRHFVGWPGHPCFTACVRNVLSSGCSRNVFAPTCIRVAPEEAVLEYLLSSEAALTPIVAWLLTLV